MNFTANIILTPELFKDGWRRFFVYYVDWTQKILEFLAMDYNDRVF